VLCNATRFRQCGCILTTDENDLVKNCVNYDLEQEWANYSVQAISDLLTHFNSNLYAYSKCP